ncbi:hypothetical protein TURU_107677 [Turdus rufiventris]|nr:hypothetical protein TURU_107677 [Turdus rufiventris]
MTDHHLVNQIMALSATSRHSLNSSKDGDFTTSLDSFFPCLITLYEEILHNVQYKPLLVHLKAMSSHPVAGVCSPEQGFARREKRFDPVGSGTWRYLTLFLR